MTVRWRSGRRPSAITTHRNIGDVSPPIIRGVADAFCERNAFRQRATGRRFSFQAMTCRNIDSEPAFPKAGSQLKGEDNATLGSNLFDRWLGRRLVRLYRHHRRLARYREVPVLPVHRIVRGVPDPRLDRVPERHRTTIKWGR